MKRLLYLALIALLSAAGGLAQSGNISFFTTFTATTTGTLIKPPGSTSGDLSLYNVCAFTYRLTGSPSGVSVAIATDEDLAAVAAPVTAIAAVTTTTNATTIPLGTVQGPHRYFYVVIATLTGGSSPTIVVRANCSPTSVGGIPGGGSFAGPLTFPYYTAGSVPYFGAGGLLSQDNASFQYDPIGHGLTVGAGGVTVLANGGLGINNADDSVSSVITNDGGAGVGLLNLDDTAYLTGGWLGVGTNAPAGPFHVNSSVAGVALYRMSNTSNASGLRNWQWVNETNGRLSFSSANDAWNAINATPLTLLNNGNVGILTAAPGVPLDVTGAIRTSTTVTAGAGSCSTNAFALGEATTGLFQAAAHGVNICSNSFNFGQFVGNVFSMHYQDEIGWSATADPNGAVVAALVHPASGVVGVGSGASAVLADGTFQAANYTTYTNCHANGTAANPSVVSCAAASAGMVSCDAAASTTTCQINTTAVTANSEISITQNAADGGAGQLNVTCNTASVLSTTKPILLSKNPGVSFTLNMGTIAVNPGCFEYSIKN